MNPSRRDLIMIFMNWIVILILIMVATYSTFHRRWIKQDVEQILRDVRVISDRLDRLTPCPCTRPDRP